MSEVEEDSVHLQAQAPSPPASSLPPYPELIIAAIDALNDPNGSNKTTISRHIESLYPNLPSSDTTFLTQHLNQMKQNGDLVMVKNNYMRPDQDAPPKRGRGRPGRTLNRPCPVNLLPHRPLSLAADLQSHVNGKKRGRPRKDKGAEPEVVASSASGGEGVKRGKGRPPKAKAAIAAVSVGA